MLVVQLLLLVMPIVGQYCQLYSSNLIKLSSLRKLRLKNIILEFGIMPIRIFQCFQL